MKRFTVASLVLLVLTLSIPKANSQVRRQFSQDMTPIKGSIKLREYAAIYFEMGDYQRALPMYEQLSHRYPGRIEFLYRTGICYLYKPGGTKYAIGYLEKVLHLDPAKEGLAFQLGKAFHANNDFDLGIKYFEFLLNKKTLAKTDRELVERLKKNCIVGKELAANPLDILISNMGAPINSSGTEYVPLLSADESTLIFTFKTGSSGYSKDLIKGELHYDDIYIAYKENGVWTKPRSISTNINTLEEDEAAVGISADGKQLLILKYNEETSGDIYMSNLESGEWTKPVKLKGEINSPGWEGTASVSADGKTLYFDSEREGGYGGTDIYKAELQSDGSWGNVVNLGESINTPYNDEAAFIHSGSKTLFFSSDGHKTMGGFDIFKSTLDADGNWSKPENLGYPINSTGHDKYYFASTDGKRGYYHQNKPDGFGDLDLYMINYDLPAEVPTQPDPDQSGGEEPVIATAEEEEPSKAAANRESEEDNPVKEEKTDPEPAIAAKSPISISGSLLTSGTEPTSLAKVKIRLLGDEKSTIAETISDDKGRFSFTNLSGNDNYEIEVVIDEAAIAGPVSSNSVAIATDNPTKPKSEAPPSRGLRPHESSSTSSNVKIANHAVCSSVEDRIPKGESASFSSEIGKIWFFTEANLAVEDEETITHKWYLKGQEISSVELEVKGPRWRTFSYKSIDRFMKGSWKVQAVSSNGTILADSEFRVD